MHVSMLWEFSISNSARMVSYIEELTSILCYRNIETKSCFYVYLFIYVNLYVMYSFIFFLTVLNK